VFRSDRFTALRGLAVLLAVVLLFALLAAACDGDGDEGETTPVGETPAADETPAEEDTPSANGGDEDEDGEGAGAGLEELESLAEEATEGVTAKVTYRVATDVDGETFEGEWVVVQRPPDSRFEIASTEGGEEFRTIIITTGGKSYLCASIAGEESCLATEAEEAEAEAAPLGLLFDIPQELAEDAENVDLAETSHRSIAGVDATCFTVSSGLADLGEGETCFSDQGLLLYLRSEVDGASSVFEATSVSTDVTDADFEPPYEIIEMPESEIPEP
jgi:hypothetical protein